MPGLDERVGALAAEGDFSGVVSVDRAGEIVLAKAYGFANRAYAIENTTDTQFALASGTKAFTALAVASLVADGVLRLETTARSVLGRDLPLIGDDVTVEQLLAHRSGIGDYLDEDAVGEMSDYVMPVPVHALATAENYLQVLDGHASNFAPGERFEYNNGAYVVLALIAERVCGVPVHDLVQQRVFEPAGVTATEFLRSDELPGRTARGYLAAGTGLRTNVLHLPVRGVGDGGISSTVADIAGLWRAFFGGRIVPIPWVAEMVRPRSHAERQRMRYGLGFWLAEADERVMLEGYDAGVSFRSIHVPSSRTTFTVISNTTDGAWPIARYFDEASARIA